MPQQWPIDDSYVTVRRIVAPKPQHATIDIKKVSSWSIAETRKSTISVLLVIARDISTDADKQYEDVKLSITLLPLMRINFPQQLHIKVVRPGSYEALREAPTTHQGDKRPWLFPCRSFRRARSRQKSPGKSLLRERRASRAWSGNEAYC